MDADAQPSVTFDSLGLSEPLVRALSELGYEAPTPIQARTIPALLEGHDVIGQAQTGTGKTAAFALPMLETIRPGSATIQAVVLTPTRELAIQVAEAIHSYAKYVGKIQALPVYGGQSMVIQLKALARGPQIIVATPGRIIDHLKRGSIKIDALRTLVLDEADEMLRMGFIDDVEWILSQAPEGRQVALFSATLPPEIRRIADRHLKKDAVSVAVQQKTVTVLAIEQRFLNVVESQKIDALTRILETEETDAVLIFRRTRTGTTDLAEKLQVRGFAAEALSGDMNQQSREAVLKRIRNGELDYVVATDVAARGLDVDRVTHVINFDIPNDVEAYVHRVGRTGRAGRKGVAILFVTPRERRMMREIESFTHQRITAMQLPTEAEVAARRMGALRDLIRKALADDQLDPYLEMVEQLAAEGEHDVAEIAAAAARIAAGAKRQPTEPAVSRVEESRDTSSERPSRASAGEASFRREPSERPRERKESSERPREPRPRPAGGIGDESAVRFLSLALGKNEGIRPGDIVGSIANEADIPGTAIGPIDIRDDISYVGLEARYVEAALEALKGKKFRGSPVNLQMVDEVPAKKYSRSAGSEDRPARTTRPRTGEDRPAYARKPAGDSDRPSYPKKSGDSDRPSYAKKTGDSDRPSYAKRSGDSDRPSYPKKSGDSDRPSYAKKTGDRDSRPAYPKSDRPSYGGKSSDKAPYAKKPSAARADRPAYDRKPASRDDRPSYGKSAAGRDDRPSYGKKPAPRDDRPPFAGKSSFAPRRRDDSAAPRAPRSTSTKPPARAGAVKRGSGPAHAFSKFKKRPK